MYKDTVMKTVEELKPYHFIEKSSVRDIDAPIIINEDCWDIPQLLKAQDEISYKAGMQKVVDDIIKIMDCRLKPETFATKVCNYCEAKLKEGESG